jgi:Suppressor of fused protein (SUFU)
MSERAQRTPALEGAPRFAEIVAILPAGWPVVGAKQRDPRNHWPVCMIQDLARYPHESGKWLGFGHSLESRRPSKPRSSPFAPNTRLNSVLLVPPLSLPEEFETLQGPGGREITFMAAVPLYQEELELKLRAGSAVLLDAMERHGITDVIDPHRVNVALCEHE